MAGGTARAVPAAGLICTTQCEVLGARQAPQCRGRRRCGLHVNSGRGGIEKYFKCRWPEMGLPVWARGSGDGVAGVHPVDALLSPIHSI